MREVTDVQELRLQQLEDISTSLFEGQYKLGRALTDQRKQLSAIETRLDRIENRMDSLETRLDRIENRMDSLENRMDSLENRMTGIEIRMETVESQIANLTELVTLALDDLAFIKNNIRPRT